MSPPASVRPPTTDPPDNLGRPRREARPRSRRVRSAGSLSYVARAATWQVQTRDPERAEVTAYQDGVRLGRAVVPVDAIAPGEAPPEGTKARGVFLGQAG
jgi:hypothetical protein